MLDSFRFARLGTALLIGCSLLAACGDDPCKVGSSRCVTDSMLRTCVPGSNGDDPYWAVTSCQPEEMCDPEALGGGDSDGGRSGTNAACVGTCEQGETQCVSPEIARYCVDGRAWQLDPCSVGELCVDGQGCRIGGDGGVRACEPGARACASREVEKTCDADGTAWVEAQCENSEICLVDRCVPDPDASCDEGSRCLDNKTALRCLGEARGFEQVDCEGDTYCEFGRCRGAVCAIGSVCATFNQVRECVDGVELRDVQCGVNEVCKQQGDTASCVPRNCTPGAAVCGDPRDPSVDPEKFYSRCLDGTLTASGVPEWVVGECTGLLTCDPAFAATNNPCQQTCTPGAQACRVDPQGIADGFSECQDDGTWGPVQRCNPGAESRLQCVIEPNPDKSALPRALCAEPVCAYAITAIDGAKGTCDGVQLRECAQDGTLGAAADCEVGTCRATTLVPQADGLLPGACDESVACREGERRCLLHNLAATPLYQVCADGTWSSAFQTCEDDEACLGYVDDEGMRRALCGAECVPGSRRCSGGMLQTCNDEGAWGAGVSCEAGTCTLLGNNDAACVLECAPGTVQCTGTTLVAPDGSTGYTMEATCNARGERESEVACAAGEVCRVSGSGEHVGCVECIGPDVIGGNVAGIIDSRCTPADLTSLQTCSDANTWSASRACTAGTSCVGPTAPYCGTCLSAAGNTVVCTQTNVNDLEVCGACPILTGTVTLPQCTQTAIDAAMTGETCASQGLGAPTAWGGVTDCCDGSAGAYLQYSGATCLSLGYGSFASWGGETDCCFLAQLGGGGAAFAYCSP